MARDVRGASDEELVDRLFRMGEAHAERAFRLYEPDAEKALRSEILRRMGASAPPGG